MNVPISDADLVFLDNGGHASDRSCAKESEADEDGNGRTAVQGGEPGAGRTAT